jgi:hypothetical protein
MAADSFDFTFLQHPEQRNLSLGRQVNCHRD